MAIAPVMAKIKSKCASGLKIIQFFLYSKVNRKCLFGSKKSKKKREFGKNRNKTKNIEKTNKNIFGFDQIWFKNEKTDKNRKQKRKKKTIEKNKRKKRQQIENTSKKERKTIWFCNNFRILPTVTNLTIFPAPKKGRSSSEHGAIQSSASLSVRVSKSGLAFFNHANVLCGSRLIVACIVRLSSMKGGIWCRVCNPFFGSQFLTSQLCALSIFICYGPFALSWTKCMQYFSP